MSNSTPEGITSRRALIGGLTLGAAAVAAQTVRPSSAQAANGDPVLLGGSNYAAGQTVIEASGSTALAVVAAGAAGGYGLSARSSGGEYAGVFGFGHGHGILGVTENSSYSGVHGANDGAGNGVSGQTASPVASGVYGENTGAGFGVAGRSTHATGTGMFGEATGAGGIGLRGRNTVGGTALQVEGKAKFSGSGKKTIPAGASSAVVTFAGVTTASLILGTIQKHAFGFVVESVVPAAGSFKIWLNQPAPTGGLPVAWFILN